ncbi:MAG: Gfo/Idh/MocA family oxidoreductase [Clostridia bacterium]|nr:Gfo/Idh/MocA family oxidoreductase [Clostridia bacterium]
MEKIRLGIIGLGQRGYGLLKDNIVKLQEYYNVTALCDVYEDRIEQASKTVVENGMEKPFGTTDYNELLMRDDVDAVLISCAWEYHVPVACAAMKAGKAVALEVGGAYSVEDCFLLVNTWEETKVPFMFMENCCYDKYELLATSMARKGVFGEIVHCSGSYSHDLREEVTRGKENRHYRLRNYLNRNCENYPTHELGPIAKLLDINRGNRMVSLVSVASKSCGMEAYVEKHKDTMNPELIGVDFKQGDIVHTIITCAGGETILLKLDTSLPRYYSRDFTVRGTEGFYEQAPNIVFLEKDVDHTIFESTTSVVKHLNNGKEYEEKYLPDIWKNITEEQIKSGHGGMDSIEFIEFAKAYLAGEEMPIDVYDAASWMVISVLSEKSIAQGGAPMDIPDFTGGKWTMRERRDVVPM